ncbi:50S ribosomal protein L11 methyltransferase [Thermosulfurimonas dismutans]|uniref:Ribosomal protein L11 methyltransferase n=1 Tax=Thermosulfurimonas dismutans TaxID=999894 RepID=A0A179D6K9_9BACT|nr:50S ribosomal protein L11 methyltransferase [Thermosulfurimonas dismutans]OAQ21740.1 Ribosomal protein L11 methyltransferase [Thermosulfurimonas dismutans]
MSYLRVKIRTDDPERLLAILEKQALSPLKAFHLPEENLFYLTYPAEDPHRLLRKLLKALPQAEFEETELTEEAEVKPRRFQLGSLVFFSPLEPEPSPQGEIYLRSSLSFGSGRHPTTKLCLKLMLEKFEEDRAARVFDLGCGSGILSLAAARLGAQKVLAADIDPRACREAKHNVEMNAFSDRILVVQGSLPAARPGTFDLVLANLTIGTITALAPGIKEVLAPGGLAILSGFSVAQKGEVLARTPSASVVAEAQEEGWLALALRFL